MRKVVRVWVPLVTLAVTALVPVVPRLAAASPDPSRRSGSPEPG